jgi:Mg2+ and Co2+ transporter CorA
MPLLDNPLGFLDALGLMALVAVTVGIIFWRKRWLA